MPGKGLKWLVGINLQMPSDSNNCCFSLLVQELDEPDEEESNITGDMDMDDDSRMSSGSVKKKKDSCKSAKKKKKQQVYDYDSEDEDDD